METPADTRQERCPFRADRPIRKRDEDKLGRRSFAEAVAVAIKSWKEKESLTIGLHGDWGSGKSSVKNMVLDALDDLSLSKTPPPLVIEFNPWRLSDSKQLTESFFSEIGILLGRTDSAKEAKKLVVKWRRYAAYFAAASALVPIGQEKLSWPIQIVGFLLGIVLLAAWIYPQNIPPAVPGITGIVIVLAVFRTLTHWLLSATKGVGTFFGKVTTALSQFSKAIGEATSVAAETGDSVLDELKGELADLLRKREQPLLMVVDDIDRLTAEETAQLFQTIKANGDLPNLIYLLLFQRDIVEKQLEELSPGHGRDFLEKIIQVSFEIPQAESSSLDEIFAERCDELLKGLPAETPFDQYRFRNLWLGGIKEYFRTPRDIYRLISALSFHLGIFQAEEALEVNPVDLIALEVLRLYEPDVHSKIWEARIPLTGAEDYLYGLSESRTKAAKSEIETVVAAAPESRREIISQVLKYLFPPAEWALGGSRYDSAFGKQWLKDLRVCSPEIFGRYFHLTIPKGDVSQACLEKIRGCLSDRNALIAVLRGLHADGLLPDVLKRMDQLRMEAEVRWPISLVSVLFEIADELPGDHHEPLDCAARLAFRSLRGEASKADRFKIFCEALKESTGLLLPIRLTSSCAKNDQEDGPFLVPEDLGKLQQICVKRIESAAGNGTLIRHPKLAYILYRWREWADQDAPRKWAAQAVRSSEGGLISFLSAFRNRSESQPFGDHAPRVHHYIQLDTIEHFACVAEISELLTRMQIDSLGEEERIVVEEFNKAVQRRASGRADDDWVLDEE